MTDATELNEAAIRARLEAATEGPWESGTDGWTETVSGDGEDWSYARPVGSAHEITAQMLHGINDEQIEWDHEFIAHARTDLPAALDEITRLRAEVERTQREERRWHQSFLAEGKLAVAAERRAEAAESALAAVRALADAWEREAEAGRTGNGHALLVQTYDGHARDLRAALATPMITESEPQAVASRVQPCPECRAGKHRNCDGYSWDDVADAPGPCPCATNNHKETE